MEVDEKQTPAIAETKSRLPHQFQPGNPGGPGRPAGVPNKYTQIKQQMVEIWAEEMGKEKFRALFQKHFVQALDRIISIMPKEASLDANIEITQKNFFYTMARKAGLLNDTDGQSPSRNN